MTILCRLTPTLHRGWPIVPCAALRRPISRPFSLFTRPALPSLAIFPSTTPWRTFSSKPQSSINKSSNDPQQILLIGIDGKKIGVHSLAEARKMLQHDQLLVEVGSTGHEDERQQQQRLPIFRVRPSSTSTTARSVTSSDPPLEGTSTLDATEMANQQQKKPKRDKEIRIRSAIAEHDLQVRLRKIQELLAKRHLVRVIFVKDKKPVFSLYQPKVDTSLLDRVKKEMMETVRARAPNPIKRINDYTFMLELYPPKQ